MFCRSQTSSLNTAKCFADLHTVWTRCSAIVTNDDVQSGQVHVHVHAAPGVVPELQCLVLYIYLACHGHFCKVVIAQQVSLLLLE